MWYLVTYHTDEVCCRFLPETLEQFLSVCRVASDLGADFEGRSS
jgi:hypothetical protein